MGVRSGFPSTVLVLVRLLLVSSCSFIVLLGSTSAVIVCVPVVVGVQVNVRIVLLPMFRLVMFCVPMMFPLSFRFTCMLVAVVSPLLVMVASMVYVVFV